jgi:hypothetical protein
VRKRNAVEAEALKEFIAERKDAGLVDEGGGSRRRGMRNRHPKTRRGRG